MTRQWLWAAGVACVVGSGWSRPVQAQPTQPPNRVPTGFAVQPPTQTPPEIQQASTVLPKGIVRSRVVARVNGSPLLAEEIAVTALPLIQESKKRYPEQLWDRIEKEAYQTVLEQMITDEAIIQDAAIRVPPPMMKRFQEVMAREFEKVLKRDKLAPKTDDPEQLKAYYEQRGQSLDLMRRQFIRHNIALAWVQELTRSKTDQETTRERLLEYYRANPAEFTRPERVVWQHIFVDVDRYDSAAAARQVAETVWQLLRNARTEDEFNTLVEKYADVDSKARRGSGQGNLKGEIRPKELEPFVLSQPTGGQGPVVETSRGYHIFRVVEHSPHEVITFEKACNGLKKKLEDRLVEAEFMRIGKEMRAKAVIEIMDGQ
jgi:parvulin-like peptidyl-prolyl isomerase